MRKSNWRLEYVYTCKGQVLRRHVTRHEHRGLLCPQTAPRKTPFWSLSTATVHIQCTTHRRQSIQCMERWEDTWSRVAVSERTCSPPPPPPYLTTCHHILSLPNGMTQYAWVDDGKENNEERYEERLSVNCNRCVYSKAGRRSFIGRVLVVE